MRRRLQSILIMLGALLASAAVGIHWLVPADPRDPIQASSYLRSLEPVLLFACGLCFAVAIVSDRRWGLGLGIGLALLVGLAGALPAASRLFADLQGQALHDRQLGEDREHRLAAQRHEAEGQAAAKLEAEEAARLAKLPLPASSMQPCDSPGTTCPANETCFVVSGDYGLGPHGAVAASGGDHRCHQTCTQHPCSATEGCEKVLIHASDTGGGEALLCLATGAKKTAAGLEPR